MYVWMYVCICLFMFIYISYVCMYMFEYVYTYVYVWRRTWGKAAVKWLHKGFLSLQDMLLAFNGWGFQESAVNPRSMIFKNSWSNIARLQIFFVSKNRSHSPNMSYCWMYTMNTKMQIFLVSKNRLQSPNMSYLWMYTMNTKIQY